jgi:hypothetical protein
VDNLWRFLGQRSRLGEADYAVREYLACLDDGSGPAHFEICHAAFVSDWHVAVANHWLYAALMAFVPLTLFWLFIWIVVQLTRWVYAGFRLSTEK